MLSELQAMGYTLVEAETLLGDVQAVAIRERQVVAAFDRRRSGGVAYP